MKRAFILLFALILCVFPAFAETAAKDSSTALFTYENVFTLNCPVFWEFVPYESSAATEYYIPIGILTDPAPDGLVMDMYTVFFRHLADFNLSEADEEAFQKYINDSLADYEPLNGIFRETVFAMDGTIPFAVFDLVDEYGPFIRAETMFSGKGIFFDLYAYADESYSVCRPLTEDDYAIFIQILESYLSIIPEYSLQ